MPVLKNKNALGIDSIAQKLEAINRIANIVRDEVESLALRKYDCSEIIDYYEELKRFEIELIRYALFRANGNQKRAAQILNLNPNTLNAKIKKFNLILPPFQPSAAELSKKRLRRKAASPSKRKEAQVRDRLM